MRKPNRRITPKKAFLLAYDAIASVIALFLAFLLFQTELHLTPKIFERFKDTWYIYLLTSIAVFYLVGFYDQMWAYASGVTYLILVAGVTFQMLVSLIITQIIGQRLPFQIYVIYWFLLFTAVAAIRFIYRLTGSKSVLSRRHRDNRRLSSESLIRVMIVGAGMASSQLITELRRQNKRIPLLAVDDNKLKQTYKVNGVPVLGTRHDIPDLAKEYKIDEIILAIPSASSKNIREIIKICQQTKCEIKIVPFLSNSMEGRSNIGEMRDIDIQDLLGRDPVVLDTAGISEKIKNKTVLVTGGGGSIGAELCRQIASFLPSTILIFDIYENNAYSLQLELSRDYPVVKTKVLIGSVRDRERIDEIFKVWKPDLVYHAAAHKHVPLMEDNPCEAVKNNVYGTFNVADSAGKHKAEKFVLISTDKAVNPTNVMGATKRLAEITTLAINMKYPATTFACVRFGNVLGSEGSVIPLFKKQIQTEKRVTVTHPDIKRFFMTIPEASSLVVQASCFAKGGEIFILDMGQPVKIVDLATDLIRLSGYEPNVDIPIQFVGLRPGEKMAEELFLDEEKIQTEHSEIYILDQINTTEMLEQEWDHLKKLIKCPQNANELNQHMHELIHLINPKAAQ
ncbi:MAG: polysaccharide biosynthesis protein [Saccharofermentanales bacterium]|jgi:FlaA1/EpsC-like NDP-sugar epimerase|nr:nucleoside-diphosphate sugar epimerase/dehydratase [Bacillota bacterium]